MKSFSKRQNEKRGITLIEIMVSTALFSVVMMISIGSIVSINNSNKKAQLSRTVMDNLNFAMENVSRNLRVGINYHCDIDVAPVTEPRDCSNGADSIYFDGSRAGGQSAQMIYKLNHETHQIERSIDGGQTFISVTSPELSIDNLGFFVTGTGAHDGKQPKVVIVIGGSAIFKKGITFNFSIQTMISQRRLDS